MKLLNGRSNVNLLHIAEHKQVCKKETKKIRKVLGLNSCMLRLKTDKNERKKYTLTNV